MTNNKKLQANKLIKTNREYLKYSLDFANENNLKISKNIIYQILIDVNNYKNYTDLVVNFDKNLAKPNDFIKKINLIIDGKPLQYALGYSYFLDFKLKVNKNTLIPRVETEGLVLLTKSLIEEYKIQPKSFVDCCAGTGCIGIALGNSYKNSNLFFIEKYQRTIDVLNYNASQYLNNFLILRGDKTKPLLKYNIKADVFVSNPPYVDNMNTIDEMVLKNEPLHSIYVKNGIPFYNNFFKYHKLFMNENYLMVFEIGEDQKDVLTKLIVKYFSDEKIEFQFKKDIYNKIRYLYIKGFGCKI